MLILFCLHHDGISCQPGEQRANGPNLQMGKLSWRGRQSPGWSQGGEDSVAPCPW